MILTPSITLALYAFIGLAAALFVVASKSHRAMNAVTIALPAAYLIIAFYSLANLPLPSVGLGGNYFFMDHLGVYEVIISAVLFLMAAIYAKGYIERSIDMGEMSQSSLKLFYLAFNLLLVAITYAFYSDNLALFWILAELTTAFSAVLVVILNAPKNIGATLKYVFITSTCMLFAFIGLILLFTLSESTLGAGTLNWSALMSIASQLSPAIMFAAFLFTFVGFAAKSGIVPFHAWLPSAHSKAPAPVSAILSGSVTSVGVYGIIRMYALVSQTTAVSKISIFLIGFGLISMVVAGLTMLRQVNLKKLTGYSTIEHMGFLLVALGLGTPVAVFWMLFYVLAHAFTKGSLFFSAGILHHQFESVRMERIKDALKLQPFASWSLIIASMAIIGTPLFALFPAKLSILLEATSVSPFLLFGLLLIFVVAASAFGVFLIKLFSNRANGDAEVKPYKAPACMIIPIVVLLAIVFVLGVFFPMQLTDLLNSIVGELGVR
jgi:hydrogenase-4 component F